MTHTACTDCGLRFSAADAAGIRSCPLCCGPLRVTASAAEVVGHQLYFQAPPEPPAAPRQPGAS